MESTFGAVCLEMGIFPELLNHVLQTSRCHEGYLENSLKPISLEHS